MLKMNFQVVNKPVYTPPIPNIQISTTASLANLGSNLGSIFAPLKPTGPCPSCG